MNLKNILIAGLVLFVVAETGYIIKNKFSSEGEESAEHPVTMNTASSAPAIMRGDENREGGRPPTPPAPPQAGDNLMTSAVASSAFEVYPTMDSSDTAKAALAGWTVKTVKNSDGTATVTMTPKSSSDKASTYTVKEGQKLYFVEMSKGDDNTASDTDTNLADDYGVLTDGSGIVQ